jgi:hypothetical protein
VSPESPAPPPGNQSQGTRAVFPTRARRPSASPKFCMAASLHTTAHRAPLPARGEGGSARSAFCAQKRRGGALFATGRRFRRRRFGVCGVLGASREVGHPLPTTSFRLAASDACSALF